MTDHKPAASSALAAGRGLAGSWSKAEIAAGVAVLLAFLLAAWRVISVPAPLGHDEATYALMAKGHLGLAPDVPFAAHRAPLLPLVSLPIHLITSSERAIRLVATLFAILGLCAAWWLGRRLGKVPGLVALIVVATTASLLQGATFFLTDLPAAALLIVACALLWRDLEENKRLGSASVVAAAVLAAAFYMRYGSAIPIALILVVAAVVWWPLVRRSGAGVVRFAAVFAGLLLPHVVLATVEFGTPWGRLSHTAAALEHYMDVRGRDRAIFTYAEVFPADWPGLLAGLAMACGVVALIVALLGGRRRSLPTPARRLTVFLMVPAILHMGLLGWTAHWDPRFLYPAVYLSVTAGAAVAAWAATAAVRTLRPRAGTTVASAVVAAFAVATVWASWQGLDQEMAERDRTGQLNAPVKFAGLEIGAMPPPHPCLVFTSYRPQVMWYSGCVGHTLQRSPERLASRAQQAAPGGAFLVLFNEGKHQPEGEEMRRFLDLTTGEPLIVIEGRATSRLEPAEVYQLEQDG